MYKVNVMNPCSCFVKNGLVENQDFSSKEEAATAAKNIIDKMNAEFCQRHNFSVTEQFGTYTVYIKAR